MGIAVDSTGSAYIAGAGGTLWPTTAGAFQTTIPGATPFAAPLVAKLTADGTSVVYSTFVGDAGHPTAITVNSTGDAFITGVFPSSNYPTTANAFEKTIPASACCPAFLTEFNATGSQLLYSSFFSGNLALGSGTTSTTGIALDGSGGIWLSGTTTDLHFPVVLPLQSTNSSGTTGFISRFDPTGASLTFSSFFGGNAQGGTIGGVAIDSSNKVHVAGTTGNALFTTPGIYISTVTAPPQGVQFTYGYAAVIDPSVAAPATCVSSQGIFFGNVLVGTSVNQTVTLTNCGNLQLTIGSITSGAASFTVPAASNTCQQPIAVNATCSFAVVFTPATAVSVSSTLTINSNAAVSTTQFFVSGTGSAPAIAVQSTNISFDPEFVGQAVRPGSS